MPTYAPMQPTYGLRAPAVQQPVTGGPGPVPDQGGGGATTTNFNQGTTTGGGQQSIGGSSFAGPTPNPYNLPDDLVNGQQQGQQFGGLLQQFEDSRQSANAANEARYQQAIQGYQQLDEDYAQRTQDLMGQLEGFGESYRQDLADQFQQQEAGLTQDMINRGLYNSTSLDQARQGLNRQQGRQRLQLEDALIRNRLDYGTRLTGDQLSNRPRILEAIERRNDVGPSYQDVAGVAGAVGQSQANVPDYLSALGGEGYSQQAGGGGGGTGVTPGTRLDPNIGTTYRTPSTRYNITSTGGSGVANPLSLSGSRSSTGSRSGGFGGSSGGGAGGSGEFDRAFGGSGTGGTTTDRSGAQVLQQTEGGGRGGKVPTIIGNADGTYTDIRTGQTYQSYEELQEARRRDQEAHNQAQSGSLQPIADPSIQGGDGSQPPMEEGETSVLKDPNSGDAITDPDGNPISLEGQGDPDGWYMGMPPIYWKYFYGNMPGIGIMAGQTIAATIGAAIRAMKG